MNFTPAARPPLTPKDSRPDAPAARRCGASAAAPAHAAGGQAGVVDPAHARVAAQETRHGQRIAAVALHAQRQRLHALQDLPGAHRATASRRRRAASPCGAHGEAEVAEGLVELHAVVAGAGSVMPGNLPLSQGNLPLSTITPPSVVPWPARYLVAVHHDVGAQRDRVAQEGAGHGVVDDQRHAVRMRHVGHGGDVQHHQAGVAQAFGEHGAGVGRIAAAKASGRWRRRSWSRCRTWPG
jgi:hypothetical protein